VARVAVARVVRERVRADRAEPDDRFRM